MSLFYRSRSDRPPPAPVSLPSAEHARSDDPTLYVADDGLVHAVNTALLLGRPLLVTGEPGTGKTQLADSVALQLGYEPPLCFVAKSVSQAQDLFYSYNALSRLKAAPSSTPSDERAGSDAVRFIQYNALGKAILLANRPEHVRHLLPPDMEHDGARRTLVLIDEVDKAPRDFPNDLLFELEHMAFRIPELDNVEVRAAPELRPVVIITSNSERGLPDPFLRRCIYYDIPFPDPTRLDQILQAKLRAQYDRDFAAAALDLFFRLRRDDLRLGKQPSTAELIGFMTALLRFAARDAEDRGARDGYLRNPLSEPRLALHMIGALIKSRDDRVKALTEVERWVRERTHARSH